MDSIKCSQCGLINVSTDAVCERCQTSLVDTGKSEVSESQKPASQTRVVNLQCISCSERLEIAPDMERFACGYCGTEQIVERKGGTIALKAIAESAEAMQTGSNETAVQIARERFEREIEALEKERTHQHPQPMKVNRAKTEPNVEKIAVLIIGGIVFIGIVLSIISDINKHSTKDSVSAASTERYSALDQTTKSSNKTIHQTGEQFSIGYMKYEVNSSWYTKQLSGNEYLNQRPDATYLFIDLDVWNKDREERTIPPFYLADENNAEYGTSNKAWASEGSIGLLENLNPGVGKRGYVIFDVPTNHTYKLKVSGGYWSGEEAYIALSPNSGRSSGKR